MSNPVKLSDVFGLSEGKILKSHISRATDEKLRQAISETQYIAIVVYGTSKQGKTSLQRSVIPRDRAISLMMSRNSSLEDLYRELLSQAGVTFIDGNIVEIEKSVESELNFFQSIGVKLGLKRKKATSKSTVKINLSSADSVSRLLSEQKPRSIVVIDNFHYANQDVQKTFATDIRSFGDKGIKIVILGTWRDVNYLQRFNSDLMGRIIDISVEPWENKDLALVLDKGQSELNIKLSDRVRSSIATYSTGNIGLLQEITKAFIRKSGIEARQDHPVVIDNYQLADQVATETGLSITETITGDFRTIAEIGQAWWRDKTRMHYILFAFLHSTSDEINYGVKSGDLLDRANKFAIDEGCNKSITKRDFSQLVKVELLNQQQKNMQSPRIAYEASSDCVIILDSWTKFAIRTHRDKIIREFCRQK